MKAFILASLLSVVAAVAHADIVVVPSASACEKARADGDIVILKACTDMKEGKPVNLACPLEGCKKTS